MADTQVGQWRFSNAKELVTVWGGGRDVLYDGAMVEIPGRIARLRAMNCRYYPVLPFACVPALRFR